jgi:selenocysteine lyase/cysteine desulfurase
MWRRSGRTSHRQRVRQAAVYLDSAASVAPSAVLEAMDLYYSTTPQTCIWRHTLSRRPAL